MSFTTTDLCDKYKEKLQTADPIFNDYGGNLKFCEPASTVKVFEDNSSVKIALEELGNGRILIIDGGASLKCALLGDILAKLGKDNGRVGMIVYGCIRDSVNIPNIPIWGGGKSLEYKPL